MTPTPPTPPPLPPSPLDGPAPRLTVVGSLNMDLVCHCPRLPAPGETVIASALTRAPGGKGGNQAVAAARLGAATAMVGAVGADESGAELRRTLAAAGVDTAAVRTVPGPTGTAVISVDAEGENHIVVVPGANAHVALGPGQPAPDSAVLCQLEIPLEVVEAAARRGTGLFVLNAAPARPLPADLLDRCDLVIVNETEYAAIAGLERAALVAVTRGAAGAELRSRGAVVARAAAPAVPVVDTVGAGDAFCAALTLGLQLGWEPAAALRAATEVGALAVTRPTARPELPRLADVGRRQAEG